MCCPRLFQLRRASQFDAVVLQRKLLPILAVACSCAEPRGISSSILTTRFSSVTPTIDVVTRVPGVFAASRKRCGWSTPSSPATTSWRTVRLRAGARVERVHVIPTCVDPERYRMACHESSPRSVDLVWIGSSSTLRGLEEAGAIWERLSKAIPHLSLRLICDRFPASFPLRIVPVAWSEETEASELAAGQIGISWLPDDLWSRGKCGLKVLQYQAAGLPVVANPVGSHAEMIRTGETGILAATADEWVDAVTSLAVDVRLRRKMGLLARQQVESNYSISAWAETFVTSMTGMPRATLGPSWKIDRLSPAEPMFRL